MQKLKARFRSCLLALLTTVSIGGFIRPLQAKSTNEIPSEDPVIPRLHSLGLINGRTDIYRCANPVMKAAEEVNGIHPTAEDLGRAKVKMQRLYDLGIRTVISLESQDPPREDEPRNTERVAAGNPARPAPQI